MIVAMNLEAMNNPGSALVSMLAQAGMDAADDLKRAGAVGACLQLVGAGGDS